MARISNKLLARYGHKLEDEQIVIGVNFFEKTEDGPGEMLDEAKDGKQFQKKASQHSNALQQLIFQ